MGRYLQHRLALGQLEPVDSFDDFCQRQIRRLNGRLSACVSRIGKVRAQTGTEAITMLQIRKAVGVTLGAPGARRTA